MQTPFKGRWIDIGDGVAKFIPSKAPVESSKNGNFQKRSTNLTSESVNSSSPDKATPSIGLPSPPPSHRKKLPVAPSPPDSDLKNQQLDCKLMVHDSKGYKHPRIAFRAYEYNIKSQGYNTPNEICAGIFKDPKTTITPPLQGDSLRVALLNHLTPFPDSTPFISTFQNFLPCLHRALRSSIPAYIAIIDLSRVAQDSRSLFPDADEVIYSARWVIRRYGFRLRNHYNGGPEWLVHGSISSAAIIRTISVAELRRAATTSQIPRMPETLAYIAKRPHAYALLAHLPFALPKTGWKTGQLVRQVLKDLQIPDEYQLLLGRKTLLAVGFRRMNSQPRVRAYLRGVCGIAAKEQDEEIDRIDAFVISDEEDDDGWDSRGTYGSGNIGRRRRRKRGDGFRESDASSVDQDGSGIMSGSEDSDIEETIATDDQTLLDAQLHAELLGAVRFESPPTWTEMSYIEVPWVNLARGGAQHKTTAMPLVIDLTNDDEDEAEVARLKNRTDNATRAIDGEGGDIMIVAEARRRMVSLPLRSISSPVSTSTRSTVGLRGLQRLEADAGYAEEGEIEPEIMEVLQCKE